MSTYTNIDWRGLTAGVDRIAQNNRTKYSSDSNLEGTKYSADVNAKTQTEVANLNDVRERDLAAKERELREKIATADREGRKEVAHITGMYGLGNSALRTVPTILPLYFNGGKGNGSNSGPKMDKTPMGATEVKTSGVPTPEFRSGLANVVPGTDVSLGTSSGVNSTTVWNAFKEFGKQAGPALAAGSLAALKMLKFVF